MKHHFEYKFNDRANKSRDIRLKAMAQEAMAYSETVYECYIYLMNCIQKADEGKKDTAGRFSDWFRIDLSEDYRKIEMWHTDQSLKPKYGVGIIRKRP